MAASLITSGYGEAVDFRWSSGNVQQSLDGGTTWTTAFALATESGLQAIEYLSATGWVWGLIYQDDAGAVHLQSSSNRGTSWTVVY